LKDALTDMVEVTGRLQVSALPADAQSPAHPPNDIPPPGLAVSVMVEPALKLAEQGLSFFAQALIPAGLLLILLAALPEVMVRVTL